MAEKKKASKPKKAKTKTKTTAEPKKTGKSSAAAVAETTKDLPVGAGANAALAGQAALAGTRAAGKAVGIVVSKARVPLVAGGGLVAGVAGGLMVIRRRNGHSRGGTIDLDHVISAARRVGSLGEEVGRVASMMEQAGGKSKH